MKAVPTMRATALLLLIAFSTWFTTSCGVPETDAEVLLGSRDSRIKTMYYHDFIGVSSHGELFDFQECNVDTLGLSKLLGSVKFRQSPDYSNYKRFYKNKLSGVESATWTRTPVDSAAARQAQQLLKYGNLQDVAPSRLVLQKDYLHQPGNYFAYYSAYPVGQLLYILVPAEGNLYIFRMRS